jgi:hypothetical protein
MITDPQPTLSGEPTPPPPRAASRGRRWLLLGAAAIGILLLIGVVWLSFSSPPSQSIALISPAEAARATAPRPFAQLRYKIRQFIYPVWRHFQRRLQSVSINTTFLALPPLSLEQTGLGPPATTNADGLRAWILTLADLDTVKERFKVMHGYEVLSSPSAYAANGYPVYMGVGHATRIGTNSITGNIYLNIIPTVRPGSLSLVITASDADYPHLNSSNPQPGITNFLAAFKATLPPQGAVILYDEVHTNAGGKLHWLLLTATSLDAQGKPIRP